MYHVETDLFGLMNCLVAQWLRRDLCIQWKHEQSDGAALPAERVQFRFGMNSKNNGTESLKESGYREGKSAGPRILRVKLWSHLRGSLKDSQLIDVNKYLSSL